METPSLVYMTNYLQNFWKTLLNSFAKPFPINVLPVSLFSPILSSENTKAYKQPYSYTFFISLFLIGCQHLVHAVDMMSSRFSRLVRGFLIFQLVFFGNDRCICRINRLHHLTVHQINLSLKICVSNTTFHNDWNSFHSSTLPFCCVLCTQGLWTFILSILTHDRTLRSQLLANYVSIP